MGKLYESIGRKAMSLRYHPSLDNTMIVRLQVKFFDPAALFSLR